MKLTLSKIRAAKPHPTPQTKNGHPRFAKYGDGYGLWLIVGPNGRKTWNYTYTINKKTRHMGLGPITDYPGEDGLSEIRDKVREMRKLVKAGIDPKSVRDAELHDNIAGMIVKKTAIPTFAEVTDRYIEIHSPRWAKRTGDNWRGTMRDYVKPVIGEKPVNEVGLEDILTILRPIWDTIPEVASRVKRRIGTVLTFAAGKEWRKDDNLTRPRGPVDHELPPRNKAKVKNHDSMDYSQLPAFMKSLRENTSGFAPRALELLVLTAARTSEILEAEWAEFDLVNRVWSIPAERMKMERDHVIPLSDEAVKIIKAMPREIGNPYVFPSPTKAKAPLSNMAMTNVLKRMNRKDGVTVHGFRSTFRTWAAEKNLDIPREIAEAALAHIVDGVEGAYQRGTYLETRRDLMQRYADFTKSAA